MRTLVGAPGAGGGDDNDMLRPSDVAELLNTTPRRVCLLIRSGELEASQVGGRNLWRVSRRAVREFIEREERAW